MSLGIGAGLLNVALFYAISRKYQADAADTVNRRRRLVRLGCVTATLLVAGTFYAYTVPAILLFMAVVPAVFAAIYFRENLYRPSRRGAPHHPAGVPRFSEPGRRAVRAAAVLSVRQRVVHRRLAAAPADRRVGLSPAAALGDLALYWLALMAGRLTSAAILPHVRHSRVLLGSGAAAIFACVILYFTNNGFGAATGAILPGRRLREHLPPCLGSHRKALPVLPSGLFQRHLFVRAGGRAACPGDLGLRRFRMGRRGDSRNSLYRNLSRHGVDSADLAGIEADRTMKRLALLLAHCGLPSPVPPFPRP